MVNEINDEYLLKHGYKEYPPTPFDRDSIVKRFQKRFDDNNGKKYFIDVVKWAHYFVPPDRRDEHWKPFGYEYETHITMYEDEKPINIKFFSNWELEDVENFMENFFEKIKPNYYETWDKQ